MSASKLRGWGYQQVGWLLSQVELAGGAVPERYRELDQGNFGLDALRKQDGVREARLAAGRRISFAFTWKEMHPELASDATARQRKDRIGKIEGQLRHVLAGLEGDEILQALLSARCSADGELSIGYYDVLTGMKQIQSALQQMRSELPDTAPLQDIGLTPQELLFQQLAKAYRDIFGTSAADAFSKTYGAHNGPFVAFVRAAFTLAGMPEPGDAAITKALQRTVLKQSKDKEQVSY